LVTTSARSRASPSEIVKAEPSEATPLGTHASPITLPSLGEKRELVTRPSAVPSEASTAAPSVGTWPLAIVKPTSAVSVCCSAACSSAQRPMNSCSLSSLTIHGIAAL
jgi:hypothetical protein